MRLIILLFLIAPLVACGGKPSTGTSTANSHSEATAQPSLPRDLEHLHARDIATLRDKCISIINGGRISSPDGFSKQSAVITLGMICDSSITPFLLERAAAEDNNALRKTMIDVMGWLKDHRAAPFLINALSTDPYRHCRASAATALGKIGAPDAVTALEASLSDSYPFTRRRAAEALQTITGKHYAYDTSVPPSESDSSRSVESLLPSRESADQ